MLYAPKSLVVYASNSNGMEWNRFSNQLHYGWDGLCYGGNWQRMACDAADWNETSYQGSREVSNQASRSHVNSLYIVILAWIHQFRENCGEWTFSALYYLNEKRCLNTCSFTTKMLVKTLLRHSLCGIWCMHFWCENGIMLKWTARKMKSLLIILEIYTNEFHWFLSINANIAQIICEIEQFLNFTMMTSDDNDDVAIDSGRNKRSHEWTIVNNTFAVH